jgi:hypothetical protein
MLRRKFYEENTVRRIHRQNNLKILLTFNFYFFKHLKFSGFSVTITPPERQGIFVNSSCLVRIILFCLKLQVWIIIHKNVQKRQLSNCGQNYLQTCIVIIGYTNLMLKMLELSVNFTTVVISKQNWEKVIYRFRVIMETEFSCLDISRLPQHATIKSEIYSENEVEIHS